MSVTRPTSASQRADRAQRAAGAIIADARRGVAYATNVEQYTASLGRVQLATVVQLMFKELAKSYAEQRNPIAAQQGRGRGLSKTILMAGNAPRQLLPLIRNSEKFQRGQLIWGP